MGGRGNLGNTRFKYTTKDEVFNELSKKNIRLMKDNKPVKNATGITNKELAILSTLLENPDLKRFKVVEIANRKSEPIVAVSAKRKVDGEVVSIPTLLINKSVASKGINSMNSAMKAHGYRNGIKSFRVKRKEKPRKPKAKQIPITQDEKGVAELLKIFGGGK